MIMFRVTWLDDRGEILINLGFRIEINSATDPYKGGLRFHPTVNLSILKFLAFEQVFKNALTTLPMGGGNGLSDFDPKEKSDNEVMKFCQAFMSELCRHIGPNTDVPTGDIGVGERETGFLFGQYRKIVNEFTGILTGKGIGWEGSLTRPQTTGFGCVYFEEDMLKTRGESMSGKTATISGSVNAAQFKVEKAIELGAKVVTISDSSGMIHDSDGIDKEKLEYVKELKNLKRGRIKEYADRYWRKYYEGKRPWGIKLDIAFQYATQNEIDGNDAKELVKNGCICVSEAANMPSTPEAIDVFLDAKILYSPGKADKADGVSVSGLEMSKNSLHLSWTREEVDQRLQGIMKAIHEQCVEYGKESDFVNYVNNGVNIAGFVKVADAMLDQGVV